MGYKNKLDSYEIVARYIPATISVMPLSHLLIVVLSKDVLLNIAGSVSWMLIANLSIASVFGITIVKLQTGFAKFAVEEKVFGKGGEDFPTTKMLLYSEGLYSKAKKDELRAIIKGRYGIELPNRENEKNDPQEAKLECREIVSRIRRTVANAGMVMGYNIRYGFFRNLIGGVMWVFGTVGSALYHWVNGDVKMAIFFALWAAVTIWLFLAKKYILEKVAFAYADALYTEFISGSKEE
ncbi:MAG: hypothetical protein LLG05_08335 [Porphyromonadaceae bacterium]|nr:hypothetical protein [Porphyromonadaceae bacterium]